MTDSSEKLFSLKVEDTRILVHLHKEDEFAEEILRRLDRGVGHTQTVRAFRRELGSAFKNSKSTLAATVRERLR